MVLASCLLCFISNFWQKEHATQLSPIQQPVTENINTATYVPDNTIPSATHSESVQEIKQAQLTPKPVVIPSDRIIHVMTDVMDVEIDALGGNIIQVQLLKYPEKLNEKSAYLLINNSPERRYIARSGLLSSQGPNDKNSEALYKPEQQQYVLEQGQKDLTVKLFWKDKDGVKVTKSLIFHRDDYEIDVTYQIENATSKPWIGNLYNQLLRTDVPPPNGQGFSNLTTYFGAAISSPEKPFQKITFKDMRANNFDQTISGGGAAMVQHYFVSAWIPSKVTTEHYYSKVTPDGLYVIGMIGPSISVLPHQNLMVQSKLYTGPALTDRLEKAAPGLQLTIDYGIFWFISVAIFWVMQKVYNVVGNWGWSIVITTILIKLLFYHLSAKSYRSMSMLKKLQPRMERLKELYANDKQKLTQATLDLYRQEKVNPMGGCLPILIQIPVFIGLYWVLVESVQLRQAPFIFWIKHDLSAKKIHITSCQF